MTGADVLERRRTEIERALDEKKIGADDLALILRVLTDRTGDLRPRRLAEIIEGCQVGGANAIDDAAALAEIERLMAAGKSRGDAVAIVARKLAAGDPKYRESVAHRLRGKLRSK